jgi:thiamine biosynthesis lipoprotein
MIRVWCIAMLSCLSGERIERSLGAMGTTLSISVTDVDRAHALAASESAVRAIEAVERRLSTWRGDSELSRLNRAPVGEPFTLSEELAADLALARECALATHGAFDPAVGAAVDAWDLRGLGRVPSERELSAARVEGGICAALELDGRTAIRRVSQLRLEEGAFGKGVGLDAALAELRAAHVERAELDLGGQVAYLGPPGSTWTVDIADPRDRSRAVVRWKLTAGSISTSGDSEHSLEVGGVRIGHILDPRTGRPARDFGSVSVRAGDASRADCFSTALFVMGPERALEWAREHLEFEVLVLEVDADHLLARASADLCTQLQLLTDDIQLAPTPSVRTSPPEKTKS